MEIQKEIAQTYLVYRRLYKLAYRVTVLTDRSPLPVFIQVAASSIMHDCNVQGLFLSQPYMHEGGYYGCV